MYRKEGKMDYGWAERGCSIVDSYWDDSAFNGGAGRAPVGEGQLIEERIIISSFPITMARN